MQVQKSWSYNLYLKIAVKRKIFLLVSKHHYQTIGKASSQLDSTVQENSVTYRIQTSKLLKTELFSIA